ncbi:HAD-IB family hydrolase [Neptunomonas sp. CHC150]|uniref:histidinol-phosphatase n=1 Tax=Neptunomonas TaxID=75687 RepID=UPI0025B0DFE2|nr:MULTISPECIES: HAD family hydrolase [Neptunomonas]MDN2660010.1 HAD-IB family hydrolase [Neptunomonas sp. CHC150]MDO6469143.1 HAD family hydrolase [Neptunomonas phycophila]
MSLAIFDLDNTLLHGDSDHAWGEFLCEKGIVDSELYRQANDTFYHQYVAGTLNIYEFLEFALKPLKELPRDQLNQLHEQFMREKVEPMITEKAEALLKQHRDKGDFLLIITATNKFVTGPIAARLGVDDIMATDPEEINGQYTGKVAGTPCFQGGKVERLNEWLSMHEHSLAGSSFYSDSRNDLPLLEVVENPVAVDADETLTQIATERGWPIISLRD